MSYIIPKRYLQIMRRYDPSSTVNKAEAVFKSLHWDFPGGAVVKNPPANAGDMGSSPGPKDHTCCGAAKPVRHNY